MAMARPVMVASLLLHEHGQVGISREFCDSASEKIQLLGLGPGRIAIEEVLKRGRDHTGAALPQLIGDVLGDVP